MIKYEHNTTLSTLNTATKYMFYNVTYHQIFRINILIN